ncbi:MAG: hypothetical protein J6R10_00685 [Tidjanibacter sp.]|nr:hypothetical protein [Tidjanibacter sp.]
MKKLFLLVAATLAATVMMAQDPADLAATPAVQETQQVEVDIMQFPENVLIQSMTESLAKQGKSLGNINDDGSIYVVAAATTARPSNMSGFVNSRNVAYSIAELSAKMSLLRLAGEQITSGRGFQMLEDIVEGEDPDAVHKASLLQKIGKIADKSLDKALAALGVSEEEIAKMNQSKKKAVYEQNYNQTVRSLVSGMVKGCAVVRIVEGDAGKDDYQVAICMKYSPEFQSLAAAIRNGEVDRIPISKVKPSKQQIMNMSPDELVQRMGTWVTFNEQGEMVIYGFGQQEVRESGSRQSAAYSRAYSQARLAAVANIKNFVAEDLVATETTESVEKLREYADGTNAYFSQQKWEQAVKAKESTLNIATEQIRQWQGVHPVSGHKIAGYVVAWTPSNAAKAAALSNQFAPEKSKATNKSAAQGQEAAPARQQTQKSSYTVVGDDDDL